MKVAVIGIGSIGGALADRWEMAGREVTRIGRECGSVSDAEAVVVAVPGGAIAEAPANVRGIEGNNDYRHDESAGREPPRGLLVKR